VCVVQHKGHHGMGVGLLEGDGAVGGEGKLGEGGGSCWRGGGKLLEANS
jgi:hypothetical protein